MKTVRENNTHNSGSTGIPMRICLIIPYMLLLLLAACSPRTICPHNLAPPPLVELSAGKERPASARDKTNAFLGVSFRVVDTKEYAKAKAEKGYLVNRVVDDSPADRTGLQAGDIILEFDGISVDSIDPQNSDKYLRYYIQEKKKSGDSLCLKVLRSMSVIRVGGWNESKQPGNLEDLKRILDEQQPGEKLHFDIDNQIKILHFDAVLGEKRNRQPEDLPSNRELFPEYEELQTPYMVLTDQFVERFRLQDQYADIIDRYTEDELWDNGFRLNLFRYLHRDPLKLAAVIDRRTELLYRQGEIAGLAGLLLEGADWLDVKLSSAKREFPRSDDWQAHIAYIMEVLEESAGHRQQAFAGLRESDMVFLEEQLPELLNRFAQSYYIDRPDKQDDRPANLKIIELAKKVDYQHLVESGLSLAELADTQWLAVFKQAMLSAPPAPESDINGISGHILFYGLTPLGPVIVGGTGRNIYRVPAAIIIDLGGDDLYQGSTGRVQGERHVSAIIDLEGNDEYMDTDHFAQGCGMLGTGLLIDQQGDDLYVGTRFSQGCAVMGVGILADQGGNDNYQGGEFNQGTAFWGIGMLVDSRGNDRYQSTMYAQGVGGTKGFGALIDSNGDDTYFAGGRERSSYGTSGIFEGSSQGLGIGFRGYTSGGAGLLLDGSGDDRFWAGNFSQGTGYFYGLGIIRNFGKGNDTYIASRYGQGASAHSAAGILIDDGGNDRYDGYHIALQGAAWDLGMAALLDKNGNDVYKRDAGGFTQAAAAHNGLAWFIDEEGDDRYTGEQGQADSNDYHGGYSLAFFVDAGGGFDTYSSGANNTVTCTGEYGIRADLAAGVANGLQDAGNRGKLTCEPEQKSSGE